MSRTTASGKNKKLIFIIVLAIVLVAAVEWYFNFLQNRESEKNIQIDGILLAKPKEINDFHLMASNGKPFSKENLNGHWTMMFFGFTNCGMICPVTMAALSDMYKQLEKDLPANQMPQVVMVSVDPDRDSVEKMKSYVTSFNPHFIGARADMAETVPLEKQLHVTAVKMQADGADKNQYSINHSAEIMLFNPKGQLQAYFSYPHQAAKIAKEYKLIIKSVA